MEVWNWNYFFGFLIDPIILRGLWTTLWLTAVTLTLAIVLGTAIALIGRLDNPLARWFYAGYVAFFRSTPLLVQLIFFYSALPQLGISLSVITAAIVGLSISESPYVAEIVRSSVSAIPTGQWEAARTLGMRPHKVLSVVILPQATRIAVPPLGNEFVRQLKNTSLVSVISMQELFRATDNMMQSTFRVLEALAVATIYYLILTLLWTIIQQQIERRLSEYAFERPSKTGGNV